MSHISELAKSVKSSLTLFLGDIFLDCMLEINWFWIFLDFMYFVSRLILFSRFISNSSFAIFVVGIYGARAS